MNEQGRQHYRHRIAGEIPPAGRSRVVSPYDGRLIATVDKVDADGVDQALSEAQRLFADRAGWLPAERRMEILYRTAELLSERAEAFAVEAAREGGKPLVDSRAEVARAVDGLRNCAELLRSAASMEMPMGVTPASGQRLSDTCYPPTLLLDPPANARVSRQEIFGPVIRVYSYSDADAAIRRANDLPFAFQAAVFTSNIDFALGTAARLAASAVMINDHTAFRVDWMPFAGLRESGLGVGGIPYTFHDMRVEKLIVMRSARL